MRLPRYRPPAQAPEPGMPGFARWLLDQLRQIGDDLAGGASSDVDSTIKNERLDLPAGATRRVSPTPSGVAVVLESPAAENAGDSALLIIENPRGPVTVTASPHVDSGGQVTLSLINGARQATFTRSGVVVFYSNGVDGWKTHAETPQETVGGDRDDLLDEALEAEVLLGAGSSAFPNGRVATDSTEIDADLTLSGVVSWALNTASVALGKLANIATQRIIGRNTAGTGAPEQITVHQALDWIVGDEWGFDGSDDAVSMGNVYQKERTNSFTLSAWVKTGLPALTGISDFIIISNVDATANDRGWSLYVHSNGTLHIKLTNTINTNDLDVFTNDIAVNDGQLHHVVATYSGGSAPGSCVLYIDGVARANTTSLSSLSATIVAAGNSLRIGRFGANASFFFPGVIRNVSVWGSVLSGANVTTLYNAGVPGNESAVGTPQSLWKLNATDTTSASGIIDYGSSVFAGTTEGGLTNAVRQGALLAKGATDWDILQPGAKGSVLISDGPGVVPAFGAVALSAIASQASNTIPVNNATTLSGLTALAVGTNTVLGRVAGNIVAAALVNAQVDAAAAIALSKLATQAANTVDANATAGTAVPTAVAIGTNTVLGRVAGNIVAAALVNAQVDAAAAIAVSKLANAAALTVLANATNGSAAHTDVAATAASDAVFRESGSTLGFGTVATGGIANNAVTLAKLATQADDTFLSNISGGAAVPSAVALTTLAGAGLIGGADAILAVGAGTGITVNANDVAVTIPLTDGDKGDITVSSSGTVFTVDPATITPAKLAVVASNIAVTFAIRVAFTAGAGGAPDDVTIYSSNAPFAFRILKTLPYVTTAVGVLGSLQVRDTSGGGGAALSSLFNATLATEDPAITTPITATTTVAASGSAFIRRGDSGVAGEIILLCEPI